MAKKISERLVERLRKEFPDIMEDIPETEKPYRLYHGIHQRSIGAWSWAMGGIRDTPRSIGSQWSMQYIVECPKIELFYEAGTDVSIIPVN